MHNTPLIQEEMNNTLIQLPHTYHGRPPNSTICFAGAMCISCASIKQMPQACTVRVCEGGICKVQLKIRCR